MSKITKKTVDSVKPGKARAYIWDSEIKGFGLLVLPSGVKSYVYQYRTPEGRTRRITIGKHGTFTADMARDKARDYRRAIEAGQDPLEDKRDRRAAPSVSDLLDKYLASGRFSEKSESTRAIDKGRIERHLKPVFGGKIADKLSAEDVRKGFAAIRDGKTAKDIKTRPRGRAIVKGGEGTARKAIRLLRAAYSWAISEGIVKSNPAERVQVQKDGERNTVVELDQYEALFQTLDRLENTLQIRRPVADAIRVIMLTGARRGEIAGLRWRHVDLRKGIISIPRGEHKTGKKTNEARIIGLPAAAQAIISRQPESTPDALVFPPTRGESSINLSKEWGRVRREAGLSPDIVLHSFRHSLATHSAIAGNQAPEIMAIMGHRDIRTSQKYIHIAERRSKELAERAAAGISAALTGSKPAEVVKIAKGGKV